MEAMPPRRRITQILSALVRTSRVPVTCKIRLLDSVDATVALAKAIEATGVAAVAVHARHIPERPRDPPHYDYVRAISAALSIPVIANGGSLEIASYADLDRIRAECGAASIMVARAAQWDPSIFRREGKLPLDTVVRDYLTYVRPAKLSAPLALRHGSDAAAAGPHGRVFDRGAERAIRQCVREQQVCPHADHEGPPHDAAGPAPAPRQEHARALVRGGGRTWGRRRPWATDSGPSHIGRAAALCSDIWNMADLVDETVARRGPLLGLSFDPKSDDDRGSGAGLARPRSPDAEEDEGSGGAKRVRVGHFLDVSVRWRPGPWMVACEAC